MIPILNYADRQALQERLLSRSQLTDCLLYTSPSPRD